MVGVAALVVMDGKILKDVRIALGAVAPTPIRARKAEEILRGYPLDGNAFEEAGQAAPGRPSLSTMSEALQTIEGRWWRS